MKKLTRIQLITVIALVAYGIWEIVVRQWAKSLPDGDPVIRADLVFILPVLAILVVISLIQLIRNR